MYRCSCCKGFSRKKIPVYYTIRDPEGIPQKIETFVCELCWMELRGIKNES